MAADGTNAFPFTLGQGASGFHPIIRTLLAALVIIMCGGTTFAETSRPHVRPRLFLMCPQTCHEDYLRQELDYFDIVRDRHLADWTLVIVFREAGNGGKKLTVRIEGATNPSSPPLSGRTGATTDGSSIGKWVQPQAATEPIVRELVLKPGIAKTEERDLTLQTVLGALYSVLTTTPHARAFHLSLPGRDGETLSRLDDPWNYWVYSPSVWANIESQSRATTSYVELGFTARRTTEQHQLWLNANYGSAWNRYVLEDGDTSTGSVARWEVSGVYARSLGKHWASGVYAQGAHDSYENIAVHVHYAPAIEYNFFPYSENASALLSLGYQTGVWVNWYNEVTQFGKEREIRPYHALSLRGDINQTWGSIQLGTQLNSFIDQPPQLRVTGVALLSLQLFEGFALNLVGEGAWVRDQISLSAESVSNEDILLRTTQLPSQFYLTTELGFSYTFGSIHNTIVNPRFGRVTY